MAIRWGSWRRPTREDLVLPALVGVLLLFSPLTGGSRIWPSLILGGCGAGALLAARLRRPPPPPATGATVARPSLPVVAVLVLTAIVFAPTLYWLYETYTESVWRNGHGLFVPLFMILLARSALRRDPGAGEESSAWGFVWLVAALALVVADAGIGSRYLSVVGLVLALPGLSLLLLGARRTRLIALPLALGIFLVPLPAQLEDTVRLRIATAAVAAQVLDWLDAPVIWHQTQLRLPTGGFSLSHNCSGFAALVAAFAFAAMLAATARSRVQAVLLLLLVYPAVAIANGVRGVALVYLVIRFGSEILYTAVHGLSGIAVFAVALAGLWLCADRDAFRSAIS